MLFFLFSMAAPIWCIEKVQFFGLTCRYHQHLLITTVCCNYANVTRKEQAIPNKAKDDKHVLKADLVSEWTDESTRDIIIIARLC